MLSVRPDGTDLRVVARGLRNPYGLIVDARHNRILVSIFYLNFQFIELTKLDFSIALINILNILTFSST